MANWTYADIEQKVRATTGRPDASMMSSATIKDYVNKVYQYVIPKELKIQWGYTYYQFFTQPNIDQYIGPTTEFQTLNPQVWADGWPIDWYESPDLFFQDYPMQMNKQVVAQGDNSNNSFSFTTSAYPILAGSLYVTDGTQVDQDTGSGTFVDYATGSSVSGTVNYLTGSVASLAFASIPAANTNITANYATYQPNRPQSILYFQSQPLTNSTETVRNNTKVFVLRPVPDNVYLIKMQGIQLPKPFVNDDDVPFRADMGPLIAYAASLEIFADFNQMDQYDQAMVQYLRYKDVSMQDTYEELLYQRAVPSF